MGTELPFCVNTAAQRGTAVQRKKKKGKKKAVSSEKTESGDQFVRLALVVAMGMELQTGTEESIIMSPGSQDSLIS